MSNVVLSIGDRKFTVACADGEEDRIAKLGSIIAEKVNTLGENTGQNELRMLLYAALVLADELDEASGSPAKPAESPQQSRADVSPALSSRLDNIAETLENLANQLEQVASTS